MSHEIHEKWDTMNYSRTIVYTNGAQSLSIGDKKITNGAQSLSIGDKKIYILMEHRAYLLEIRRCIY